MADISLLQEMSMDESDEGVYMWPTTEEEALPPLSRVLKYAHAGNPYDRKMVARIVPEMFRTCPVDILVPDIPQIMEIIQHIGEMDEAMVRADLLEQIPHMASQALECSTRVEPLKNVISDYLIPLVVRNLDRSENAVDKIAHSTLIHMLEQNLITKQQAEIQVCPAILALSNEQASSEVNTGAITLMSKMAPLLGSDVTERVFLGRFVQLCSSETFYVRKVCASIIGNFCAVVGKDKFIKILLPCYLKLCEDSIWGVKKACAEVVMFVSAVCPQDLRRSSLSPAFTKLLKDSCRWVQMAAFQTLGPFIATFAEPPVTTITFNKQRELVFVDKEGNEFTTLADSGYSVFYNVRLGRLVNSSDMNLNNCGEDVGKLFDNADGSSGEIDMSCGEKSLSDVFGRQRLNIFEDDEDTVIDLYENLDKQESDQDIKEIVETVKNAVLSYRNSNETEQGFLVGENSSSSTIHVINNVDITNTTTTTSTTNQNNGIEQQQQPEQKQCDNLIDSIVENLLLKCNIIKYPPTTTTTTTTTKEHQEGEGEKEEKAENEEKVKEEEKEIVNNEQVNNGDKDEDDLQMFNNYNYWYISPDIPIDLNVLDNKESKKVQANYNNNNLTFSPKIETNELYDRKKLPPLMRTESENFFINRTLSSEENVNESIEIPIENKESAAAGEELNELEIKEVDPPQDIVPQVLIDSFILMTDPSYRFYVDNEMSYHCAYSLPAVVLTLGPDNWHLIKNTVEILATDMQYKVRRAVASSLHELAAILGIERTTEDLTPIFEGFIKDLHEVRVGILQNLAKFLQWVKPEKRRTYLPRLSEFYDDTNWRFRHELAKQLILLVPLFKPKDLADIALIADGLLDDKVSAVRQVAISLVTELTRYLSQIPGLNSRWLVVLSETCAHSKKWKRRQTFASLCYSLLQVQSLPPEQFATEIMPHLLDLSWDPVANVRLVVAKTISKHIITNDYFSNPNNQHFDNLGTVLRRLQADKDRDVRYAAEGFDNNIAAHSMSNCSHLKTT